MRNKQFAVSIGAIFRWALVFPLAMAPLRAGDESGTSTPNHFQAEKAGESSAALWKSRIVAARAGDRAERRKILDQLRARDTVRQFEAVEMAKSVGGADMICGLGDLLSVPAAYQSSDSGPVATGQGDIVLEPAPIIAAKALAELVGESSRAAGRKG